MTTVLYIVVDHILAITKTLMHESRLGGIADHVGFDINEEVNTDE